MKIIITQDTIYLSSQNEILLINQHLPALCCLLDPASYQTWMVTPSFSQQAVNIQAPTPPLMYILLTSCSPSLLKSFSNSDAEMKMSWTYTTLLALLIVLLTLSCESDAGECGIWVFLHITCTWIFISGVS